MDALKSILGWLVLIVASAIPGVAAFLFHWDRVALGRAYFSLGIGACLIWVGYTLIRGHSEA